MTKRIYLLEIPEVVSKIETSVTWALRTSVPMESRSPTRATRFRLLSLSATGH